MRSPVASSDIAIMWDLDNLPLFDPCIAETRWAGHITTRVAAGNLVIQHVAARRARDAGYETWHRVGADAADVALIVAASRLNEAIVFVSADKIFVATAREIEDGGQRYVQVIRTDSYRTDTNPHLPTKVAEELTTILRSHGGKPVAMTILGQSLTTALRDQAAKAGLHSLTKMVSCLAGATLSADGHTVVLHDGPASA